ncbi:MAG: tRNA adenosine(34) deaminase TadA [Planctomycetota bacterium]
MDATVTEVDTAMMRLALQQAERAAEIGEVPVGAVVYRDQAVIAKAHNRRETWADPTAHAELIAMREAAKKLGTWRLDGCRVAVTLEPCPMCAGAMVNARVQAAVFGITDPKMGCVQTLHRLLDTPAFNHRVQWVGGVLAEESLRLLQDFFRARRRTDRPPKPGPPQTKR